MCEYKEGKEHFISFFFFVILGAPVELLLYDICMNVLFNLYILVNWLIGCTCQNLVNDRMVPTFLMQINCMLLKEKYSIEKKNEMGILERLSSVDYIPKSFSKKKLTKWNGK